jgi:hypothetical protein
MLRIAVCAATFVVQAKDAQTVYVLPSPATRTAASTASATATAPRIVFAPLKQGMLASASISRRSSVMEGRILAMRQMIVLWALSALRTIVAVVGRRRAFVLVLRVVDCRVLRSSGR